MKSFGVDKIHLTTRDFKVKDCHSGNFSIESGLKQGGKEAPWLMRDESGHDVSAWKMYHNSEKGLGHYSFSPNGLMVSFNPSKIHHPYNLVSVQDKGYKEAITAIKKEMTDIGVAVDLDKMKIVRADLARQDEMNRPVQQYNSAFNLCKMRRAKNQRQYEGGYLFGNSQKQSIFYDKGLELENNGVGLMYGEKHLMRGEIRLLKPKSFASLFKLDTLDQLNLLSPEEIENHYKSFLNRNLFINQYQADQTCLDFDGEAQRLEWYRTNYGRDALLRYLAEVSLDLFLLKFGSIDTFINQVVKKSGYRRRQPYEIRNKIAQMISDKARFDDSRGEVSVSVLLAEVQTKFAA